MSSTNHSTIVCLELECFLAFFQVFFFLKTKKQQLFQLKSQRHLSYPLSSSPFLLSSIKTNTHTHIQLLFFLKYYHQTTLQFIHCPNPKNLRSCLFEKCHSLFQSLTSLFSSTAIIMLNLIASKPICYAKNLHSISLLRLFPLDHSSVTRLRLRQCTLAI